MRSWRRILSAAPSVFNIVSTLCPKTVRHRRDATLEFTARILLVQHRCIRYHLQAKLYFAASLTAHEAGPILRGRPTKSSLSQQRYTSNKLVVEIDRDIIGRLISSY